MADKRVITSSIWRDEWFGPLNPFHKCLWIGLFSACADDQGRLQDSPILIRADVFPYDDMPAAQIDAALDRFAADGKIYRYEHDGKRLIQIVNWWEHQQQQWAMPSKWGPPEGWVDHVRSNIKGDYVVINWGTKTENAEANASWVPQVDPPPTQAGGNDSKGAQVAGHDPDPALVLDPDPVPDPVVVVDARAEETGSEWATDEIPPPQQQTDDTKKLFSMVRKAGILLRQDTAEQYLSLLDEVGIDLLGECFKESARCNSSPTPAWLKSVIDRCKREGVRPGQWKEKRTGNGSRASPNEPKSYPAIREYIAELAEKGEISGDEVGHYGHPQGFG